MGKLKINSASGVLIYRKIEVNKATMQVLKEPLFFALLGSINCLMNKIGITGFYL